MYNSGSSQGLKIKIPPFSAALKIDWNSRTLFSPAKIFGSYFVKFKKKKMGFTPLNVPNVTFYPVT